MKKIVLTYGLISGLIISTFMAVTMPGVDENTDMGHAQLIGYASMVVALSTIFVGIKKYRDNELNGIISFGKAFLTGLYIAIIASTLYVLTWMVLSEFFLQDFMANYTESAIADIKASDLSQIEIDEQIKNTTEMMEMYKNPVFKFFFTYIEILPVGLLISLISAAILKKNN